MAEEAIMVEKMKLKDRIPSEKVIKKGAKRLLFLYIMHQALPSSWLAFLLTIL